MKNRRWLIILNVFFIYVFINMVIDTVVTYNDIKKLKISMDKYELKIEELKKNEINLKENLKNIKKLDTIEKIAREKLCMKKNGEIIYKELKK